MGSFENGQRGDEKMTREKIIHGLYKGDSRAIKEAIKTLEKEPCEDAISKASVFEILGNLISIPYDFDRQINEKDVSESMDEIKALPSVTAARKKEEWIPCDEKLPKPNELVDNVRKYYLIQDEYGDMHVASYLRNGWISIDSFYTLEDDVVAWMPLPEPYKAEMESEESK